MHQRILIKVTADTSEEAKQTVSEWLEESVDEGPWDYVGEITNLSDPKEWDKLKEESHYDEDFTIEDFAKEMESESKNNLEGLYKSIQRELEDAIRAYTMKYEDAVLHLNPKDSNDVPYNDRKLNFLCGQTAPKILSGDIDPVEMPKEQTPESMANFFVEIIKVSYLLSSLNMFQYYLKQLDTLSRALQFQDKETILGCTDIHYFDSTKDYTKGKETFYFWCDRHY